MEPKKTKALSGFHPAKGRGTDLGCGDHWAVGRRIEQRQLGCRVWCGVFSYPDDTVSFFPTESNTVQLFF